ncbi:tagaturonate reductase [Dyadobacter jejuensis]|uniref:Tagaturonate reductase n=1 Tax=Dyadobacter jejuensis TaxID=1082580 RepID=A0A316AGX7_9BACT|nr:tagaturonate reductase [Dyadobacter jejuensis]PWJ56995.1 tagaturonate reductase [Dyadobacter jejuensis]
MSRATLSPQLLDQQPDLLPNHAQLLALPEKIIQFGTGVLLRGLPDYFVNKANQQGVFNGRVVVVKSTSGGGTDAFLDQSSIFSHTIRGIDNGKEVDHTLINTAISRTLNAHQDWEEILQCASNPSMQIVLSNTTEVGIQFADDDLKASPPVSFPGKLTAFLLARYEAFDGSEESGMVIVPTELIIGNGDKLKAIVLQQATTHQLDKGFIRWIEESNHFCNSLVDRIVPGKPDAATIEELAEKNGYDDQLLIVSEVYSLWAIQAQSPVVAEVLSFAQTDPGVVIAADIDLFRELKLRLLNGTHTLASGWCYLNGQNTVRECMESEEASSFISEVMLQELSPAIPFPVEQSVALEFGNQVLDRFRNPFIRHKLIDITVQYTAKMKMRNVPTLLNHYRKSSEVPQRIASGFAAFLQFMKPVKEQDGQYFGERNGEQYPIRCDAAAYFNQKWEAAQSAESLVEAVLSDEGLWGTDLTTLPGFADSVKTSLAKYQITSQA